MFVPSTRVRFSLTALVLFCLTSPVMAQDLFELEVFPYRTAGAGETVAEVFTNAVPRSVSDRSQLTPQHRPVHLSAEVTRAWGHWFETGVFVETAPFGPSGTRRFGGGHVRPQVRFPEGRLPFRVAVSGEYAFNRPAFDDAVQTIELRPIVEREAGRLTLIVNPAIEHVVRGPAGEGTSFDLSGRAAWRPARSLEFGGEYFSMPGRLQHLHPDAGHHLVFGTAAFESSARWEVSMGIGRCVDGAEPWIVKSAVSYRFGR